MRPQRDDDAWRDRAVLVTGATGLLGGWVAGSLLERGARVIALVRDQIPDSYLACEGLEPRITVVRGELQDLALLERTLIEYEISAVFHLGAQTQVGTARRGPYHTFESNVRGTYTLLEAVRRVGTVGAVIVASSDKAYGAQERLPYTEDAPLLAVNPYDASKASADLIARGYARAYDLPIVVTRCGNLFGGGDLNWSRLVPGTIRSILRGERPVVRSDGTPVRDYLYVADAADAYIEVAEHARDLAGEALNFSLERPLSVLEMLYLIGEVASVRIDPEIRNDAVGEIPAQFLSAEKARRTIGWRPRVDLETGLRETFRWYRDYLRRD